MDLYNLQLVMSVGFPSYFPFRQFAEVAVVS